MELFCGDCLEVMKSIPDGSVDMILCDLPYGTTQCKWDVVIPFESLWGQYQRVIKSNGAIVLFGTQPFTSFLVTSNIPLFRYQWVWEKERPSNFFAAKYQPLNNTEDIAVFSRSGSGTGTKSPMKYYPQGVSEVSIPRKNCNTGGKIGQEHSSPWSKGDKTSWVQSGTGYPKKLIKFGKGNEKYVHPTQKPVSLLEYLIKTYTLEGETVLDNTMGSGSTGVACVNTGRDFIGIEQDDEYFEIAKNRIADAAQRKEAQPDLIPDAEIFREPDQTLF